MIAAGRGAPGGGGSLTLSGLAFGFLYTLVALYTVLASIEFGGGALLLAGRRLDPQRRLLGIVLRYMGPTWESTATILVIITVGYSLTFPSAVPTLAPPFFVPLSIALVLMAARIGFFIAMYVGMRSAPLRTGFALASLLAPVALSSFFVIWAGANSVGQLLASPLLYAFAPLALAVPAALGGAVLAGVVEDSDEHEVELAVRLRRLAAGLCLLIPVLGLGVRFALAVVDPEHLHRLEHLYLVIALSGVLALASAALLWRPPKGGTWPGALCLGAQCFVALQAYGITEGANLGPGRPALYTALNSGESARFLVVAVGIAALVLLPSLGLLLHVLRPWEAAPAGSSSGSH